MKQILILVFLLFGIQSIAGKSRIDTLIVQLDKTISMRDIYMKQKEHRISELKNKLQQKGITLQQKYNIQTSIYAEYETYICDSALHYIDLNLDIADKLKRKDLHIKTLFHLSTILSTSGMYKEAIDNLNTINRKELPDSLITEYYLCYERAYIDLGKYAHDNRYSPNYYKIGNLYRDSLLAILNPHSGTYWGVLGRKYADKGDAQSAVRVYQDYLKRLPADSHEYAIVTSSLAYFYQQLGNKKAQKEYLILSAIADIEAAIKENESLRNLANILFQEGEIDRAYEYIKFSLDDANFYNARLRRIEISKTQPIIDKAYQLKSELQKNRLKLYLIFISILSVFLLIALYFIYRQVKAVSIAQKELHKANLQLKELNHRLFEANHIKEEYIGHFMNLCSSYIDRLELYSKMVNRKVLAGQINDLIKMTKSSLVLEKELNEFYSNFDNAFLKLYPNFVEEFNTLFAEENRFVIRSDEQLNTELRIFALIRLGINDSSKIASFLRYSVNTIYTYRTKVKNKSLLARDNFEDEVMKIGSFWQK